MAIGTGRVAWVSGGSSGIGAAVVARFLGEGATTAVLDVQEPAAGTPWERIDLADRDAVAAGIAVLAGRTGWPDVLVLCAGITGNAPLDAYPLDLWDRIQAVNLTGPLLVLREVFPRMVAAGYGRIVGFASGTAVRPGPGSAAYASSKAGVIALMKVAAMEGAEHGVTANTIAPGITDTPMTRGLFGGDDELLEVARHSRIANPQGAVLQPDDLANAVDFLCSEASGRFTGQVLHVNAGSIMP